VNVAAGEHWLRVEYKELTGNAAISVSWQADSAHKRYLPNARRVAH
jgi:hypothetical protein